MNIHIKPKGDCYDRKIMEKIVKLIRKYDCSKHVYFMIEIDNDAKMFKEYASDIPICVGHDSNRPWEIVDRAIDIGAEKVQLYKPYFNEEIIRKAHEHGIICNVFWADDPDEARKYLDMGIDTILTNEYNIVSQIIK